MLKSPPINSNPWMKSFSTEHIAQMNPYSDIEAAKKSRRGRKRGTRRERHSKIRTAQGLRDRRMRLSLEVAPEFFDIQDMLGHDKASKTLRWLITASRPAIQDLIAVSRPMQQPQTLQDPAPKKDPAPRTAALARESRAKARARARERTEKKSFLITEYSPFDQVPDLCGGMGGGGSMYDYDQWDMERILQADVGFLNWDV